jgi:PAS domain S-box-containing protein
VPSGAWSTRRRACTAPTGASSTASCTWNCCRARSTRSCSACCRSFPRITRNWSRTGRESLYRDLFLSASEGIYRSLPGGGFLDVNPALARMLGYESPAELLLACCNRARDIYVDQARDNEDNARLLAEGRIDQVRVQVYRRDGSPIWVSENARVIHDAQGRPIFFEGSLEDITAQVEAEQALKQSQALYQVLLDNTRDGVFLIQRGMVRFANKAMADILGYPLGELIGLPYMSLIDAEDAAVQEERKREREAGSRDLQMYEVVMVRKDGMRLLCEVRADAVDYQGDIASTGTLRDITEERNQKNALQQAERRYRELFHDSPVGLFRSGLGGEIMEVNPALASMLGFADTEMLKGHFGSMYDVYADPSEREVLVEKAKRDGAFSHHETRVFDASGGIRWVSISVRLTRDENNAPAHFTGSALDVQERRRMQQALISSENKYRTLVEQSHVGVFHHGRGPDRLRQPRTGRHAGVTESTWWQVYLDLLGRRRSTRPRRCVVPTAPPATSPRISKAACCIANASACTRASACGRWRWRAAPAHRHHH